MDFSSRLTSATQWLLRPKCNFIEVYTYAPIKETHCHWMVVIEAVSTQNIDRFKGSGIDRSIKSAFLKALVELGENYIVQTHNWKNRNGMAGGFFKDTAIARAKFEQLERDAFYHHYQNHIPFEAASPPLHQEIPKGIVSFKMSSAVKSVHCFITTNRACTEGVSDCLIFGMGAHANPCTALTKSLGEYLTMVWDHKLRVGWCKYLFENPNEIKRLPDLHHAQSRDKRNREIFRLLCTPENLAPSYTRNVNETKIQTAWTVTPTESPLKFIKYFRLSNTYLNQIHFGFPEPKETWTSEEPLFHPMW